MSHSIPKFLTVFSQKQLVDIYMERLAEWREPSSPPQTTVTVRDIVVSGLNFILNEEYLQGIKSILFDFICTRR